MKKLLYGTTALAAAGIIAGPAVAAEQIKSARASADSVFKI